jgi:hypothetical protein
VQWDANIIESDGLPENEVLTPVGVHKCDEDDWKRFYETTKSSYE